jgi:sugar phosphate isomerase/epimerase
VTVPIGLSGIEFCDCNLPDFLQAARSVEVDGVEVWWPLNFESGIDDGIRAVREAAIRVVCVSSPTELGDAERGGRSRAVLLEAIEIAWELRAPVVNTYFGAPGRRDDEAAIARFLRSAEPCLDRATSAGVIIAIENEFNAFGRDDCRGDVTRRPEGLRRLIDTADCPALGINLDPANMYCAGVRDLGGALDLVAGDIVYAHIKDVRSVDAVDPVAEGWVRYTDYEDVYDTTATGLGEVGWRRLLPRLLQCQRLTAMTVEPHSEASWRLAAAAQAVGFVRDASYVDPSAHNE